MKLIALIAARNEDWILGFSARAALMWCDEIVILDHASTDRTLAIANQIWDDNADRVTVIQEPDPEWREMEHRQRMLEMARQRGATHIAMVDADEVLTANLVPTIRETIENMQSGVVLQLPWLCLANGIGQVYSAGMWGEQDVSVAFEDDPRLYWAAENDGYCFHHRQPRGRPMPAIRRFPLRDAGLLHFQFANMRRLRAKQALYQMIEVTRWPSRKRPNEIAALYGRTVREAETGGCNPVPLELWLGFGYERFIADHLRIDAEPWQEAECKRLWSEHGPEKFAGLNLFGVVG